MRKFLEESLTIWVHLMYFGKMNPDCNYISYEQTNAFSKIVLDYLEANKHLKTFYQYEPSIAGIKKAISERNKYPVNREALVQELQKQYTGYHLNPLQQQNLQALLEKNTFTVTTAHQPNIFTGHLYFIYKILHAIKLCDVLKNEIPDRYFVPIFYMGSEDADLDELGHIYIDDEKLEWKTGQKGAIGRMNTKGLEKIIERLESEFGTMPYGAEMVQLCKEAYLKHDNIQSATLFLVNELFKDYGLLVLIPDNVNLKRLFADVIKKELTEQFSHPIIKETAEKLSNYYKVQTEGREINLFYLDEKGRRERIEFEKNKYLIRNLQLSFTQNEFIDELNRHPERFSPNVILRGLLQERILPNVAFIGGGGELAYWFELKSVFEAANIFYPVLLLRNSFLLIEKREKYIIEKLQLTIEDLFKPEATLQEMVTRKMTGNRLMLTEEKEQINKLYDQVQILGASVDTTLQSHIAALHTRVLQDLQSLEKKMLRAEKRKFTDANRQISTLKSRLFPYNTLQERIDNFMPLYAKYGKAIISILYQHSLTIEHQFGIVDIRQ